MVKPNFRKRLLKEIEEINENSSNYNIYAHVDDPETLKGLKVLLIGPENSPYHGGFFLFSITIPDRYPFVPPIVNFLTPSRFPRCRIHPNLYADGKVCLSILNTWGGKEWVPVYSLEKIFLTIQGLLDDNPVIHEPGQERVKKTSEQGKSYVLVALQRVLDVGVLSILEHPDLPLPFHNVVQKFLRKHGEIYLKQVEALEESEGMTVNCFHGDETIRYNELKNNLIHLLSKFSTC